MWRTDENFTVDRNQVGWANYDDNHDMFDMPSTLTRAGGRRPAYATCRTQDTNQTFSVIVYHAPFSQQAILGDRRLANSEMLNFTPQNAANIHGPWAIVNNSLLSGDFNIDYITDSIPSAYDPLRNRLEPVLTAAGGRAILTSLRYQMAEPDGDYYSQDSLDYRSAAYDNIFYEDGVNRGGVVDVIALMMDEEQEDEENWHELVAIARNFNFNQERGMHGLNMGEIGQDVSDNWLFYLSCISDHLPVFAEAVI